MQVCVVWVCCGSGQVCRCVLWMWTSMQVWVCCGVDAYVRRCVLWV